MAKEIVYIFNVEIVLFPPFCVFLMYSSCFDHVSAIRTI